jgi:preprotein translocase subunit SecF
MRLFRIVPDRTAFPFYRLRHLGFTLSLLLLATTALALPLQGLNFGIDFLGGILVEVRAEQPIDLAPLRARLQPLGLGEVKLQTFGEPTDLLIRIQDPASGGRDAQAVIQVVREALGPGFNVRRTEMVGPTVGAELLEKGIWATVLSLVGIGVYVALRFDWPFAVAALAATAHDVLATVGLYAVLQMEFNLTSVAALLTLAGYSINDTVVVFDRIRENLRKRKGGSWASLIDESVNQTLARTLVTSLTTLLAVLALVLFGGDTIRSLGLALGFGILVGTFSSIFVAASLLPWMASTGAAAPAEIPPAQTSTTATS